MSSNNTNTKNINANNNNNKKNNNNQKNNNNKKNNNQKMKPKNNINNNNMEPFVNNQYNSIKKKSNFKKIILVSLIGIILLGTTIGLIFLFFKRDVSLEKFKDSFSYVSKDIVNNRSVFETVTNVEDPNYFNGKTTDVKECIKKCKTTPNCDGMTFNSNTYDCVGYKNGILIKSEPHMIAWEKPQSKKKFSSKVVIADYIDKQTQLDSSNITQPLLENNFMFSGFINITNWYDFNHGYWKNVFLKGSVGRENDRLPKTDKWEDIVKICPQQCIGVWLAPYTNNMRICITTIKLKSDNEEIIPQPNTQSCVGGKCFNNSKIDVTTSHQYHRIKEYESGNIEYLEFLDILNIPINKEFFIGVNITKKVLEIYMNDKLNYIIELKGNPVFNNHPMTAKINPTFSGNIKNLSYLPYSPTYNEVKSIYNKL